MKSQFFVLLAVFSIINCSFSQTDSIVYKNHNIFSRMYLKGGIDFSSFSNTKLQLYSLSNADFWGSLAFDYNKHWQFEFLYAYAGDLFYNYINIQTQNPIGEYYSYNKSDNYFENNFALKANYFIDKDRTINPIYFTGSIIFSVQRVTNSEFTMRDTYDSTHHWFLSTINSNIISVYNRVLIGPAVGFGLFFDFGRVNFQTEFSFSAKVAPFVNRGFKEYAFNLSLAPVLKMTR